MSGMAVAAVYGAARSGKSTTAAALLALADNASVYGCGTLPDIGELARMLGLTPAQMVESILRLEQSSELVLHRLDANAVPQGTYCLPIGPLEPWKGCAACAAVRTASMAAQPPKPEKRELHAPLRRAICEAYALANGGAACPWSGRSGKALNDLLAWCPSWTLEQWGICVGNRFDSEGESLSAAPEAWLKHLPSFLAGPKDRYGKTRGANDGRTKSLAQRNADAARQARELFTGRD